MKAETNVTLLICLEDRLAMEAFILADGAEKKKPADRAVRFSLLEKIEVGRKERQLYFKDLGNGSALADFEGMEKAQPLEVPLNQLEQEDLEKLCDAPSSIADIRWQRRLAKELKRAQETAAAQQSAPAQA